MIGEHLRKANFYAINYTTLAASICEHLHRRGHVTYLQNYKAWQITHIGREVLRS